VRAPRANAFRDGWAGDLRAADAGREVRVAGWVHRRRDHGGLVFIDLRDRSGIVQLVVEPGGDLAVAEDLRPEHVVSAAGTVVERDPATVNANLATGQVEIRVSSLDHLASAETPPFPIEDESEVDELLRLRHRAIDLRRPAMQQALVLRHRIVATMRRFLEERDFLELETPILTKSTPEGARDFLVPNRREAGTFYALPQSPQLFKQLLMISGYERYYQIARCFRDEDLRADRQPEFTQLDLEMGFVEEDDVVGLIEGLMAEVFALADGFAVPAPPYDRMAYAEAMDRFGSDRPDRRFGLELRDVSDAVRGVAFRVFSSVLDGGGRVRALNAGAVELSRAELDGLNDVARRAGGQAVAWAFVEEGDAWRSPIAKFFDDERRAGVVAALDAAPGDLLVFAADSARTSAEVLGAVRLHLADRFGLRSGGHDVLWVVDFPMFEATGDAEHPWTAVHHPFTAPKGDLAGDPGALLSRGYDLVCDGTELGGGSIRISDVAVQERVFALIGMDAEEAQARFGFLLEALRHGAPPHGGIAFGVDRIAAQLAGRESIRDVIAFPKTASGADPLTGAPSAVDARQLRELGVRVG
jgi:aspartyl-tRNA synthetase